LLQVPVWQAIVSTEIRKADVAKGLASNPVLRQEAASMMAQSFARPLPQDFDFLEKAYVDEADGVQRLLYDLKDQYTRVVGSSGECMCVGVGMWMVGCVFKVNLAAYDDMLSIRTL